eukprot:2140960-Amphidinium_carterae.1
MLLAPSDLTALEIVAVPLIRSLVAPRNHSQELLGNGLHEGPTSFNKTSSSNNSSDCHKLTKNELWNLRISTD